MAQNPFLQNHDSFQAQSKTTIANETLPAGFSSYIVTLQRMAAMVQAACIGQRVSGIAPFSLKNWVNSLLNKQGIQGHDFQGEVVTLFFSAAMQLPTDVTRLTLNWSVTFSRHCARLAAIVTTRFARWLRSWLMPGTFRASCAAAKPLMLWITFGVRSIWIGLTNGYHLILPTNKLSRAGHSGFPGGWNIRFLIEA